MLIYLNQLHNYTKECFTTIIVAVSYLINIIVITAKLLIKKSFAVMNFFSIDDFLSKKISKI